MELNKIYQGHVLNVLKTSPDESVDCVITSPPYWGLRDYGIEPVIWDADPNCEHEWGKAIEERVDETGFKRNRKGLNKAAEIADGNPRFAVTNIPIIKKESQLCLKCSAWKGSLGLEPTPELYIKHLLEIFDEIKRVLKKTGICWVVLGDSYASGGGVAVEQSSKRQAAINTHSYPDYAPNAKYRSTMGKSLMGIPEMFVLGMRDRGWRRRNTIIWHKPNCMPSSAKDRFTVDFEYIYFFTKTGKYWFEQQFEDHQSPRKEIDRQYSDGFKETQYATNKNYSGGVGYGEQGRNKRCVWTIPTQSYADAHFATFPEALVEPMIRAGCPESGIVLDPFSGSGTTLKVAERLNRQWVGIDLKPEYLDMAEKRLSNVQKELL